MKKSLILIFNILKNRSHFGSSEELSALLLCVSQLRMAGLLFRGDTFVPSGETLLAKSGVWTPDKYACSIHEHVTTNPPDSCWISFSGNPAVSLWFAVNRGNVGDTVYVSAWYDLKEYVYRTAEHVYDSRGQSFASWADEYVMKWKVDVQYMRCAIPITITQDDLDWANSKSGCWDRICLPVHRRKYFGRFLRSKR